MPKYKVYFSKDAGVFNVEIIVDAETSGKAREQAMEHAKKLSKTSWTYNEQYFSLASPKIRIDDVTEVGSQ